MRRREFIGLVAGSAAAWPFAARAQQHARPVIGFLSPASSAAHTAYAAGFRLGLSETGYIEGRNVSIDYRWAEDRLDQLPALAAQLVEQRVSVIVASANSAAAIAAKAATATIPIVFVIGADPVRIGLVASLSHPGGNATGVSSMLNTLMAKRLELLCELAPASNVIGVLINPDNPSAVSDARDIQSAALSLARKIHIAYAKSEKDFDAAFASLVEHHVTALFVAPDTLFSNRRNQLVALAARHGLPAIYSLREYAVAGGLLSYGPSFVDAHRQAGFYAGRILKGEKPVDLPVLQATRFELVINHGAAKALGLAIPPTLLARADEVLD
jgi:ABC-type uncharacterized transport system substrate-binding protein